MIQQDIQTQMKEAMRAHDAMRLETLRFVLSQIKYAQIAKRSELTEDDALGVLANEVKKRREAIEMFRASGREALVSEEEAKLAVIMTLMPAQLSEAEVEAIVKEAVAKVGGGNMGMVMKEIMPKVKGRADGKMVSEVVKRNL